MHFIAGIVLCCTSIIAPSIDCSLIYDRAVDAYRESRVTLLETAPGFANMTTTEVDAALAEIAPVVDRMLVNVEGFLPSFKLSWWLWFIWIVYSYGVSGSFGLNLRSLIPRRSLDRAGQCYFSFTSLTTASTVSQIFLIVAGSYFMFIRRSMKRVAGLDTKDGQKKSLRRAWWFASLTSVLVTMTGLIYAGASLAVAIWTHETVTSGYVLSTLTLITL